MPIFTGHTPDPTGDNPFVRQHQANRNKAAQDARAAAAALTKKQQQDAVAAEKARRENLAKPLKPYKTNFPI